MLSFTVRLKFADEDRPRVTELLRDLSAASRQEPGCVNYLAHFVEDDPSFVMIYECYKDNAALDAHRASSHFQKYAVGGLYQLMRERSVENLTLVV
jgi:quinol monooxygenase YgiN